MSTFYIEFHRRREQCVLIDCMATVVLHTPPCDCKYYWDNYNAVVETDDNGFLIPAWAMQSTREIERKNGCCFAHVYSRMRQKMRRNGMLMYHSTHEVRNVFPQRYSSDMEERVIAKMYGLGYHRISWKPCMLTCKPQPILHAWRKQW